MGSLQLPRRRRRRRRQRGGTNGSVSRSSRHRSALASMAALAEPAATTVASPEPQPEPEPPTTTVPWPLPEPPAAAIGSPTPGPSATATPSPVLGPVAVIPTLWQLQRRYIINCPVGLNNQINLQLSTTYLYRLVASYFYGSNVTLSQVSQFFQGQSTQQMWLHNQHGGLPQQPSLNNPVGNNSYSAPMVVLCALYLAMSISQALLNLQQPALGNNDVHLSSVPQEQPASTQQAGDHPTSLPRQEQPEATRAENLHDKFSQGDKKN